MAEEEQPGEVRRRFISRDLYQLIRRQIITGEIPPGTVLKDQQLASRYAVSRTPVREALLKLETEELVQTKANRWTQVTRLDVDAAVQRYPIIWTLEALAVRMLPRRLTAEELAAMEAANAELADALDRHDAVAAAQADFRFHQIPVEASGNRELAKILAQLKTPLQRMEIAYFDRLFASRRSVEEHQAILDAFRAGRHDQVIAAIEENWRASLDRLAVLSRP
ncbi:GntR family transcriptional regulator [Candidatus Hydrogenisulfobacillus filiaventi]|uniref:GntR family transcriptional regulator n=1 Tax=Candidatus Hydrogenisulfobacillus filiaventi TaxID=2707344 RepID=A0A6F8ZIX5_9FIRM|nr:GntR family transcriptional regulator [Candidatus Hydrogenisulfobacillus filiaventi]